MTTMCKLALLCATALAAASSKPIPNVTQSFCDNNVDFSLDASGAPVGANFSYRLCMDVGKAASRMECTQGVPCPGGPDLALTVFTDGIQYSVTHDGNCTAKACPGCAPPAGMPFSFLLIDGADGDTSRGVAAYQGTTQMDGQTVDHFMHDRGQVAAGFGKMHWYLAQRGYPDGSQCLLRTSYVQPASGPSPGASGNRDFSGTQKPDGTGTRVAPAPASSFDVPPGCSKPPMNALQLSGASPRAAFGDGF